MNNLLCNIYKHEYINELDIYYYLKLKYTLYKIIDFYFKSDYNVREHTSYLTSLYYDGNQITRIEINKVVNDLENFNDDILLFKKEKQKIMKKERIIRTHNRLIRPFIIKHCICNDIKCVILSFILAK